MDAVGSIVQFILFLCCTQKGRWNAVWKPHIINCL